MAQLGARRHVWGAHTSGTNDFSSGTVRATRGVLRLTHESTRLAGAAEREQLSARSAVFFVSTRIRFVGGHGRSDAPAQAAKTTLFAAASEGAVSKKSLAIFSNQQRGAFNMMKTAAAIALALGLSAATFAAPPAGHR